jgi:hypothetical protein
MAPGQHRRKPKAKGYANGGARAGPDRAAWVGGAARTMRGGHTASRRSGSISCQTATVQTLALAPSAAARHRPARRRSPPGRWRRWRRPPRRPSWTRSHPRPPHPQAPTRPPAPAPRPSPATAPRRGAATGGRNYAGRSASRSVRSRRYIRPRRDQGKRALANGRVVRRGIGIAEAPDAGGRSEERLRRQSDRERGSRRRAPIP